MSEEIDVMTDSGLEAAYRLIARYLSSWEGVAAVTASEALWAQKKEIKRLEDELEKCKQAAASCPNERLVMTNARRLIKAKNVTSNGRLYMELFGTRDRVQTIELDPDGNVCIAFLTSYNAMMEIEDN